MKILLFTFVALLIWNCSEESGLSPIENAAEPASVQEKILINPYEYVGIQHNKILDHNLTVLKKLAAKGVHITPKKLGKIIVNESKRFATNELGYSFEPTDWNKGISVTAQFGDKTNFLNKLISDSRLFSPVEKDYLYKLADLTENSGSSRSLSVQLNRLNADIIDNLPHESNMLLSATAIAKHSSQYWSEDKLNEWQETVQELVSPYLSSRDELPDGCTGWHALGVDLGGLIIGGIIGAASSSAAYAVYCVVLIIGDILNAV